MTWQQFLTEKVLKECWHVFYKFHANTCKKCGKGNNIVLISNRTYDNRNDLMDLYEAVWKDGKWEDFFWDFAFQRKPLDYGYGSLETTTWLFCFSGEGYEDRCKMVAEFYGWREADHD